MDNHTGTQTPEETEERHVGRQDMDVSVGAEAVVVGTPEEGAEPVLESAEPMVPLSEARKYRKRAQAAEKIAGDLQRQVEEQDEQIRSHQRTLEELEHRQSIDELLQEAGAIDLESTRLLTEAAMAELDEPDVAAPGESLQRIGRDSHRLEREVGEANFALPTEARCRRGALGSV